MYESPIDITWTEMQTQISEGIDELVIKACKQVIPTVNKDELIKALKYDRGQYEKGYIDGRCDRNAEIIRCNQCIHYEGVHRVPGHAPCSYWKSGAVMHDDFCSKGEEYVEE